MSRLLLTTVLAIFLTVPGLAQEKPTDPPKAEPAKAQKPKLTPEERAARREARRKAAEAKVKEEGADSKKDGKTEVEVLRDGVNVEPITGPQPKCVLSTTTWNFGTLWYGDPAETEIRIENQGEAPLEIKAVKTSCGCTAAKPKVDRLEPGKSDVISLTYNTKKNVKNVAQYVTVETNDPRQPAIRIKVEGTVNNLVDCEPRNLALGNITRDFSESRSVVVTNQLAEPIEFKLDERTTKNPSWDFSLEETETGKVWKLTATPKPPLSYGAQNANVALISNNERVGTFNVQMVGSVPHRVEAFPRVVQRIRDRDTFVARVLNRDTSKPIKILKVDTAHPEITAEVREPTLNTDGSEQTYEIVITVPKAVELPRNGARIKIHTDAPEPQYETVQVLMRDTARQRPGDLDRSKLSPEDIEKLKRLDELEAERAEKDGAAGDDHAGHDHAGHDHSKKADKPEAGKPE